MLKIKKAFTKAKKKDVPSPASRFKRPHLILLDSIRKDRKGRAVD